jgi:hypothetical protein
MRAGLSLLAVAGSLLLAGALAGAATADAPTIDVHTSSKGAVAVYQLSSRTSLTVVAADIVSSTQPERHFAAVAIWQEPACSPDCLRLPDLLLNASAEFDTRQLHGGINQTRLDVTLPVIDCALSSCPTTIEVGLVWEPNGQPIHETNSMRTDTETCQFTKITRFAYTDATPTGLVGDRSINFASGEASGNVLEQSSRIVGSGDPSDCL